MKVVARCAGSSDASEGAATDRELARLGESHQPERKDDQNNEDRPVAMLLKDRLE
jgi:hypothetical protein